MAVVLFAGLTSIQPFLFGSAEWSLELILASVSYLGFPTVVVAASLTIARAGGYQLVLDSQTIIHDRLGICHTG